MKRLNTVLLSSVFILSLVACGTNTSNLPSSDRVNSLSVNTKDSVYPFELQKDFFPLYNASTWKYDIYDKDNKLVTNVTKTLDVNNEDSLDFDKKNNYYVVSLKKTYANPTAIKDKDPFEYFRRRDNQLAYGKMDNLYYYPGKAKAEKGSYDPYLFRPFSTFPTSKLETVTVKAGTFQCVKSEFSIAPLDKYTIWYAKGVGEVKRIYDRSGFSTFRFELTEFSNTEKQFLLKKEIISLKELPASLTSKTNMVKNEYLKINELPLDLFEIQSSSSIYTDIIVFHDNSKNTFDINFVNKSLISKDNINLHVSLSSDAGVKNISVFGENQGKPIYKGKVVDKLPVIKK